MTPPLETSRGLKSSNAERAYEEGLYQKIDLLEKMGDRRGAGHARGADESNRKPLHFGGMGDMISNAEQLRSLGNMK